MCYSYTSRTADETFGHYSFIISFVKAGTESNPPRFFVHERLTRNSCQPQEVNSLGRKNRRKKSSYSRKMKIDPKKLIRGNTYGIPAVKENRSGTDTANSVTPQSAERIPQRGDVWFAELGYHPGTSVQDGCRPEVILSNDTANFHSETLTVVPMTTRLKKAHLPTHVILSGECGALDSLKGPPLRRLFFISQGALPIAIYIHYLHVI